MQDQQDNRLAARAFIVATATLGAIVGFLLGCVLALPLAENQLKIYMQRVSIQETASISEASNLLDAVSHSAYAPCSEAELGYFRELVFHSDYLKDAGLIRSGKIQCSATVGRPVQPVGHFTAATVPANRRAALTSLIPIHDSSLNRSGLERGGAFVLFGSHIPVVQGDLPIHTAIVADPAKVLPTSAKTAPATSLNQLADGVSLQGDALVARHCSTTLSNCVTASLTMGEARRGEPVALYGTAALGLVTGAFFGFTLCFLRRRSLSLDQQLKKALANDKLDLVYQPIVNLADGKIVGAEALARWTNPDGVSVSPDVFVRTAEEHGFVGSITTLVLRRALNEFRDVLNKTPDFRLNVNVAAADLIDPQFLPMLDEAVRQAGVSPSNIAIEVTETSAANQQEALESIRALRRMGFAIYIDDFGTGYSNLSYLLYLSVDCIKIDKAFVKAIGTDSPSVAILPQIIGMARSLNLGVVVEGIESESQASYFPTDKLRMYGQGFLYGRPVPAHEFLPLVGIAADQPALAAETANGWSPIRHGIPTAIAS